MNDLYKYFESDVFSAMLNVASGFHTLKTGLEIDPNFDRLIDEMDEWENQLELYDRIQELLPINGLNGCEHPYDMALTAYLCALSRYNMPLAILCSRNVHDTPQCFWAAKMAKELRGG